jgi:ADP-heptose:LPS heptosyltransferase
MGDVAMTVPVILAFVKQHPDVKVTVVSRVFFKPIFHNIPNVDFFTAHVHHRHKGLLGLFRLYKDLKSKGVTEIADLHNVLRSKIIRTLFSLNGKRIAYTDKGRAEKKLLTQLKDKQFEPLKTMFERHAETFQKLGYAVDLNNSSFLAKEEIPEKIIDLIGEKNQQWIGIAPFAHYNSKTYPLDLMLNVVTQLSQNPNLRLLLLGGGKREKEKLNTMAMGLTNVYNLTGIVSFEKELQLISNLDVMVSMDSGNAHLGAMYGVKTITIWGATHPYAGFAPFNQPFENCLVSDREKYPLLPTSVYGNKKVAGYEDVMRTITPESVVALINKNLKL